METHTVSSTKALELQATLKIVKSGRLKVAPDLHQIIVKDNAMLVDPVNDEPFVFVAPNTVHVFRSKPGSGTDHMRQRIAAELWFQQLADKPSANEQAKQPKGTSFGM